MKRTLISACSFLLIAGFGSSFGPAQSVNSGDVRGTVYDQSGTVLPGVTVTVVNIDTGVSKDYVTNNDGLYDTSSIVIGRYQITFSDPGFEKLVRGPITVHVGFTPVNGELKVGASTQQITVTADVALLQTDTGQQSTTLESKSMSQFPRLRRIGRIS